MEVYAEQSKWSYIISAILMIIVGALFIINRDLAMDVGFIIIGIFLIIAAIIPMIAAKALDLIGLVLLVLGILLIILPSVFTDVTTIILGIFAIIIGAVAAANATKEQDGVSRAIGVIVGVVIIIAGISMILDMDIAFQLFGVFLVIAGVLNLIAAAKSN